MACYISVSLNGLRPFPGHLAGALIMDKVTLRHKVNISICLYFSAGADYDSGPPSAAYSSVTRFLTFPGSKQHLLGSLLPLSSLEPGSHFHHSLTVLEAFTDSLNRSSHWVFRTSHPLSSLLLKKKKNLSLFNYSCMPFLPIPPPSMDGTGEHYAK